MRRSLDRCHCQVSLPNKCHKPKAPDKVTHIHFEGASQLSASQQTRLTSPYLNSCMGLIHINALIRDVSQWYLAAGFVTSRAFLPEQDLAKGTLTIAVLEGRIEAIVVNGERIPSLAPSSRAWSGRCSICVIWSRV